MTSRFGLVVLLAFTAVISARAGETHISIENGKWCINGKVTYPGTKAEGLLMNVRMVNSTFEDRKKPDFDPDANTQAFIDKIPDYAAHGARAFTLNLQGGMPGYEGAVNSTFRPDGTLRDSYLKRIYRVTDVCDRNGIAVILGLYYQRQDQILRDEQAVRAGVVNAMNWIVQSGLTNVVVEIANEYPHRGFNHKILKSPKGEAELIRLAKKTAAGVLVSTSGLGNGKLDDEVARASCFLLIHYNGTALKQIPERISALRKYNKPIVCNEDDKVGEQAAKAAQLSVENGASYGLMLKAVNQYQPFEFKGAEDDAVFYKKMKELTSLGR